MDCDWEYLKTLRTLKEPRQPMPRFKDLLEYLATPGLEDIWLLLDIKVLLPDLKDAVMGDKAKLAQLNKHADDLFRAIAATMADVKASRPWNQRVLVGCWAVSFSSYSSYSPNSSSLISSLGQIPFPLHQTSSRVSHNTHRIQHRLRTPISQSPWY